MSRTRKRKNGIKRSHLKRFSGEMVNTGRGPNPIVLAEYNERAKSIGFDEERHVRMNRMFGFEINQEEMTSQQRDDCIRKSQANPDLVVKPWAGVRHHGFDQYRFISLHNDHYPTGLKMGVSGKYSVFVETYPGGSRRSIVYSSTDLAKAAFIRGNIGWAETLPSV